MKKFLFVLLILVSFGVGAEDASCEQLNVNNATQYDATQEQLARRGCCSHHGGVCGCEGGRTVCCDGGFSPTCGCHANDVKSFLENNPSEIPNT